MRSMASRLTSGPRVAAAVLVSFGAVLGATVGCGALLDLAERPDGSTGIDRAVTRWTVEHRDHALTALAHGLSTIGSQVVLLPLTWIVVLALLMRRRVIGAALLVLAWAGALGLYNVAKQIVARPRPPMVLWLTRAGGFSFPSGHASQSAATFAALLLAVVIWRPRLRAPGWLIVVGLAAGIGWSRVYLGVHWATDVLAGWCAAAAWVSLLIGWRSAASLTGGSGRFPRGSPEPLRRT
jgi:undecaprenyl-diphosphatase